MAEKNIVDGAIQQIGKGAAFAEKALSTGLSFFGEGLSVFGKKEKIFTDDRLKNLEILEKRKEAGELTVISAEELKSIIG